MGRIRWIPMSIVNHVLKCHEWDKWLAVYFSCGHGTVIEDGVNVHERCRICAQESHKDNPLAEESGMN